MKFAVISDTHGQHDKVIIPEVDCLIHCGDISSMGTFVQVNSFLNWFTDIEIPIKVFVAGNHDFMLEDHNSFLSLFYDQLNRSDIIYLRDSSVEVDGIKIHGSPMSPRYGNWAFMAERGQEIKKHWDKIPADTEILITHSPPARTLDLTTDGVNAGCEDLMNKISHMKKLKYHLFGHIHEGRGLAEFGDKNFINATCVDENYEFKYQPYEFEIETKIIF